MEKIKEFLKKIIDWFKTSNHYKHVICEFIATWVGTFLFGIGAGLGFEFGQGFKGDYKEDLIADSVGVGLATLIQVLFIIFGGIISLLSFNVLVAILVACVILLFNKKVPHYSAAYISSLIFGAINVILVIILK